METTTLTMPQTSTRLKNLATQNVLVCQYASLPEPPTLNAILVMGQYFKSVTLLRNNQDFPVENYPFVPVLKQVGKPVANLAAAQKGTIWKFSRFFRYCFALRNELRTGKYPLVVFHDYLSLLAFWLVKKYSGYQGLSWFNSYDAIDPEHSNFSRFSLMNWVIKNHEAMFGELDFFSLPADERKIYYPVNQVKRAVFVIPNFPAVSFYKSFYKPKTADSQPVIKMIYQGALGGGHGFENIIPLLGKKVRGKGLELILKGWIAEDYKQTLVRLAENHGVADRLKFEGFSVYRSVPELASTCSIGLAIFTKQDVMNKTLGTASNKIYEYAALGLPVALFDTPHFRQHLDEKSWAYFTDLTEANLLQTIDEILDDYENASKSAHRDFLEGFNFEKVFLPALQQVELGY